MGRDTFDTPIGKIHVNYASYCVGCPRFEPFARATCKTDDDGKVIWTKDHTTIIDGVSVSCTHQFLCQHVAHELADKLKGENINAEN